MKAQYQRRNFIKLSLASGCMIAVSKPVLADQESELSCEQRISDRTWKVRNNQIKDKIRLLRKLRKKFGDEIVSITKGHTMDTVEEQYADMKVEKRDLSAVKSLLWDGLPADQFTVEKIADTEEYLEYRVDRCAIADAIRSLNEPELGYAVVCAWDDGFCKGVNPDIKFTRTKTLINGDDCCNHAYELKRVDTKKI